MWWIEENDLDAIAIGAGYWWRWKSIRWQIKGSGRYSETWTYQSFISRRIKESDKIVCLGMIGAPTVGIEKMPDLQSCKFESIV